ncbi:MAG: sterol desaturase family protein [Bacteroidota bacterium]
MGNYWDIIVKAYQDYAGYLWSEITFNYDYKPWWENYFYLLILVSLVFLALEWVKPWRKDQPKFRKDFWLDFFYMFFNFFLFSLIIFNALSDVVVNLFNDFLALFGAENTVAIHIETWPRVLQLLTLFLLRDFIHWWVHRLLHRVPFLWNFHKVHHSVEQMGFAAHLRFHWMESVVYKTLEYLPLAMIGFGIDDFFIVHLIALSIGHWNHANIAVNIGPLKYVFNNPQMHIWHHAKDLPESRRYGVNFGLSLSIWDYIFKTNYIPRDGRDIPLGFHGIEQFPKSFFNQSLYGFNEPNEGEKRKD